LISFLVRGADHMLSEKSQWTENGTMFVDLDWLLNALSPLSASAELLVNIYSRPTQPVTSGQSQCVTHLSANVAQLPVGKDAQCLKLYQQSTLYINLSCQIGFVSSNCLFETIRSVTITHI